MVEVLRAPRNESLGARTFELLDPPFFSVRGGTRTAPSSQTVPLSIDPVYTPLRPRTET
jgi:hypothetical protein